MQDLPTRRPSIFDALLPILVLAGMLATSVYLYGDNSSYGANQIALLISAMVAVLVGLKNGFKWLHFEEAIVTGVGLSTNAVFILLAVGSLIGTWILAGIVPTLVYYGLQIMHPSYFYPAACIICALVGLSIGSSWTVAGTIGVALMGVSQGLGLSPEITAGAVISGAYFGDKMSPLSDTTNLAPAAAGAELFAHIRHMTWTTIPSITIALIIFSVIGLMSSNSSDQVSLGDLPAALQSQFHIGWYMLLPLFAVLFLAIKKFPAFPTILIGALLGALFAVVFQPQLVTKLAGDPDLSQTMSLISGAWMALFDGYKGDSGNAVLDELLNRGGMTSMLNTVWLIMCAMMFGATMERAGLLSRLVEGVARAAKSASSLIIATLGTAIGTNIIAADQYIAIVLPGRIYREEYEKRGLEPVNLSRALEDAGTLTSPLVPWNTCGAFMAATLGVATTAYLPFAFFNLLNPLIAAAMAVAGVKILYKDKPAKQP